MLILHRFQLVLLKKEKEDLTDYLLGQNPAQFMRLTMVVKHGNKFDGFNKLKSSSTWSFPPRPWTNHVRWIEPDANKEGYIFVAIEAGALIKSFDGGKTWKDRVENGPYDTHTLVSHKKAPQRLYSAAGDGYFESQDYGLTWENF